MFRVQRISSLDLPELAPYRTMKRPAEHREQGIFVAEGEKVVRRLLESKFTVVSVLLPEKWLGEYEPILHSRPEDIPVFVIEDKQLLESLVGFSMFQGVMAVGKIPRTASLNDVIERSRSPRLFVAVDALTNAENLGVLVRNAVAFGAQALIVGETCTSPFLRRAVRNSMGTIFQLPAIELAPLQRDRFPSMEGSGAGAFDRATPVQLIELLHALGSRGVRRIAAHPHTDKKTIWQADFTRDCCIIFGSEGYGISPAVLEACDETVAIPMPPTVDSLNVGSAAAVFLYEVNRQRTLQTGKTFA